MKTLIIITALITIYYNPSLKAGDATFKIYQVTDNGSFHFAYPDADLSTKQGMKPVTIRTFYLETIRHGLLPSDLTYEDFLQMKPEEIQAMIEQNQQLLLATREADKSQAGYILRNIPPMIPCAPHAVSRVVTGEEVKATEEESAQFPREDKSFYLPWVVKVVVDPEDGYELPDFDKLPSLDANPGVQKLELPATARILTNAL